MRMGKTAVFPALALCALGVVGCMMEAPSGSVSSSGVTSSVTSRVAAEQACRNALVNFHGVSDVTVLGSEPYQGGGRFVRASVRAGTGNQREVWQCIAYANGSTGELEYLGADSGVAGGDGLSGTQAQFDSMVSPCIAQASRLTGASQGSISILDRIRTGGGPILTLSAAGAKYTCRLEDDRRVTVFSEFAN